LMSVAFTNISVNKNIEATFQNFAAGLILAAGNSTCISNVKYKI
jgi:hypothetical protein